MNHSSDAPRTPIAQRSLDALRVLAPLRTCRAAEWLRQTEMPSTSFEHAIHHLLKNGAICKAGRSHTAPYAITSVGYQMLVKGLV